MMRRMSSLASGSPGTMAAQVPRRPHAEVQSQICLAGLIVEAMALKAFVGENGTDVPVKGNLCAPGGRRQEGGKAKDDPGDRIHNCFFWIGRRSSQSADENVRTSPFQPASLVSFFCDGIMSPSAGPEGKPSRIGPCAAGEARTGSLAGSRERPLLESASIPASSQEMFNGICVPCVYGYSAGTEPALE